VFLKDINTFVKLQLRFIANPSSKEVTVYKAGKSYMERLILHRELKVVLYQMDENSNFIGDIIDPRGNLAVQILKNGYSKLFMHNTPISAEELNEVKNAQRQAQNEKLRVWRDFVGSNTTNSKTKTGEKQESFEGTCIQVFSGDSFSVKNARNGEVIRIFLSHVKAPAFAKLNSTEQDKPWAWQAKEYLRKSIIGKQVKCEFDFTKQVGVELRSMHFYSVLKVDSKDKTKTQNITTDLIEQGLVQFTVPRTDDDSQSKYLNDYMNADKNAQSKKVGIFSNKNPGNPNYSDLISATKKKKIEFRDFLVNQKNLACTVEFVFSGSKFKLRIEKTKCYIPFSLIGIKTVSKDKNNTEIYERFYNEATNFANETILQREGKCDIIQADKVGNYFGVLTINEGNFASVLLREGLAVVSDKSVPGSVNDYINAEKSAMESRKGIWENESVAKSLKDDFSQSNYSSSTQVSKFEAKKQDIQLKVTDFLDLQNFYVNILPNKTLDKINTALDEYNLGRTKTTPLEKPIKKGVRCLAKFSTDDQYYRAIVTNILKGEKYEVQFLDFGTYEEVSDFNLVKIDANLSIVEPQAVLCELGHIKYTKNYSKKANDSVSLFTNLEKVWNGRITYSYVQDGASKVGLVIFNNEKKEVADTVQSGILSKGYAKLDKGKPLDSSLKGLQEIETKACSGEMGLWAENEYSDDEYEQN
jgi:staphylococcal nuclease domain-containing protein 1